MCKPSKFVSFLLLLVISSILFKYAYAVDIIETESVTISATVPGIVVDTGGSGTTSNVELIDLPKTAVRFSGLAYPFAPVTISKKGKEIITINSDDKGVFSATLPETYDSTTIYSVQAKDLLGNKSLLLNYPIVVQTGYMTHLSGILFAPTIVLDKSEVALNDFITISGYALPEKTIVVNFEGPSGKEFSLVSKNDGTYLATIPLAGMTKGKYAISVHYENDARNSKLIKFTIGEKNVLNQKDVSNIPGDCNKDSIINLVDFSILAFWYKKPNPPICVDTNSDEIVNLVDFSILAFYWTG